MNSDINKAIAPAPTLSIALKEKLVDFVYDAEGDIATALESYAAKRSKTNSYGSKQQAISTDLFIVSEKINEKSVLELYQQQANPTSEETALLNRWHKSFIGLFEIEAIDGDRYRLMNWLTAKTYTVYAHQDIPEKERSRWQPGEIILTIIAPFDDANWFFFSDRVIKGQLSQPKLAVAVGEFRDNFPEHLYADAPELLNQAWESVKIYHDEFVNYFGSDRIVESGYQLNKQIQELQQQMSKQRLAEAGIDDEKSLSQMLAESGASEEEFAENAANLGADAEAVAKIIKNKDKLSMVTPKVDLPPDIKQAETVTVFSHPKWGQMFLPTYSKFGELLTQQDEESEKTALKYLQKYLTMPEANYYVWQQLSTEYPEAISKLLQQHTNRPDFDLNRDLEPLLEEQGKPATPQLPSIASVPIHLNNLFETALAQVQKSKSKKKKKAKKGFLS